MAQWFVPHASVLSINSWHEEKNFFPRPLLFSWPLYNAYARMNCLVVQIRQDPPSTECTPATLPLPLAGGRAAELQLQVSPPGRWNYQVPSEDSLPLASGRAAQLHLQVLFQVGETTKWTSLTFGWLHTVQCTASILGRGNFISLLALPSWNSFIHFCRREFCLLFESRKGIFYSCLTLIDLYYWLSLGRQLNRTFYLGQNIIQYSFIKGTVSQPVVPHNFILLN